MKLTFTQRNTHDWATSLGGPEQPSAYLRARRFIEEALELAQACGVEQEKARAILDHVYSRPPGDPYQEVGGVGMTLLPLCEMIGISAEQAFEDEYARVNQPEVLEKIRRRQFEKADDGL